MSRYCRREVGGWSATGGRAPGDWHQPRWPLCCDLESARNAIPCPTALTVATPFKTIYLGLWSYNSVLSCIAIGGMFYALTWQTHLLALVCGRYRGSWQPSHSAVPCPSPLPRLCDTHGGPSSVLRNNDGRTAAGVLPLRDLMVVP